MLEETRSAAICYWPLQVAAASARGKYIVANCKAVGCISLKHLPEWKVLSCNLQVPVAICSAVCLGSFTRGKLQRGLVCWEGALKVASIRSARDDQREFCLGERFDIVIPSGVPPAHPCLMVDDGERMKDDGSWIHGSRMKLDIGCWLMDGV